MGHDIDTLERNLIQARKAATRFGHLTTGVEYAACEAAYTALQAAIGRKLTYEDGQRMRAKWGGE